MTVTCADCGIEFSSPVLELRRKDGRTFYCPNGHGNSWKKAIAEEKSEEEAARAEERKEVERLEAMFKLEPSILQRVKDVVSGENR